MKFVPLATSAFSGENSSNFSLANVQGRKFANVSISFRILKSPNQNQYKTESSFTLLRTDFASSPFRASDCAEKDCVRGFGTRERIVGEGVSCCIDGTSSHEFVLKVDFEA